MGVSVFFDGKEYKIVLAVITDDKRRRRRFYGRSNFFGGRNARIGLDAPGKKRQN